MEVIDLAFDPLRVLHNEIDDQELRRSRRTIWGDLTPPAAARSAGAANGLPYTYALFIQSKDGRTTDSLDGNVGRMSGVPADRFGQYELRAYVDAFLVGAATLRADRAVGVPAERELLERRRREKGNSAPLNVFFSASGNIPADSSVFREPEVDVALFVTEAASDRVDQLRRLTPDVVVVQGDAPLRGVWRELGRRGVETIGFEGGPKMMGLALRDGLVHELLLTHSPLILGGPGTGFADIVEPLVGITTRLLFLGLDESTGLLFERSSLTYERGR